jgi:hypothetical protein
VERAVISVSQKENVAVTWHLLSFILDGIQADLYRKGCFTGSWEAWKHEEGK